MTISQSENSTDFDRALVLFSFMCTNWLTPLEFCLSIVKAATKWLSHKARLVFRIAAAAYLQSCSGDASTMVEAAFFKKKKSAQSIKTSTASKKLCSVKSPSGSTYFPKILDRLQGCTVVASKISIA